MHFGFIIYGQLDYPSGGFLYDRKLVDYLRAQGHQVSIFSQAWTSFASKLAQNWDAKFSQEILSNQLDLLIQDELNHASLFRFNHLLKRESNIPVVSLVHHLRMSEKSRLGPFQHAIENAYLRSVDAFLVNSANTRKTLQPWLSDDKPAQVVQPGGDRFGSLDELDAIQTRAKVSGPLRILFVGSISARKQPHLILEALNCIPGISIHATFAGDLNSDPNYSKRFQTQIKTLGLIDKVDLLGHIESEVLIQQLRLAQVLVLPSSYEGFGIAYLEGMAYGLPAIGMDRGGAAEIIEHGKSGYLLASSDPAELADRIQSLATDRDLLAQMSLSARARFDQFPTWDQSFQKAEAFLVALIAGQRSS